MFKRFLRHNFNIPLAVLLVITAVVFITVGIITGKNAVRAEAAEADSCWESTEDPYSVWCCHTHRADIRIYPKTVKTSSLNISVSGFLPKQ